ncbi:hypothetical protein RJ641_019845 [Dillenia turbinata]|uniref:Uncharacterized protein n=1 Tax=Dillenia turbinata TaxID=194707 RepID=A0AAN8UR40_9MAGN
MVPMFLMLRRASILSLKMERTLSWDCMTNVSLAVAVELDGALF